MSEGEQGSRGTGAQGNRGAGARGEAILQVGETEYRILFTNRALAEAESAIGKSILAIAQGFSVGITGLGDVARLLAAGLEAARRDARAGGRSYTVVDAYRIMDQVGFAESSRAVMEAIAAVLRYSPDEEAEPDPVQSISPNP